MGLGKRRAFCNLRGRVLVRFSTASDQKVADSPKACPLGADPRVCQRAQGAENHSRSALGPTLCFSFTAQGAMSPDLWCGSPFDRRMKRAYFTATNLIANVRVPEIMDLSSLLLVVHLLIALSMVGIILLQPSDGGGTGLGSDSGNSSFSAVRGKGSFLTRLTWGLAGGFMAIALLLAWLSRAPTGGDAGFNAGDLNLPVSAPAAPVTPDAFSNEAVDSGATPEPAADSGAAADATGGAATEGSAAQ